MPLNNRRPPRRQQLAKPPCLPRRAWPPRRQQPRAAHAIAACSQRTCRGEVAGGRRPRARAGGQAAGGAVAACVGTTSRTWRCTSCKAMRIAGCPCASPRTCGAQRAAGRRHRRAVLADGAAVGTVGERADRARAAGLASARARAGGHPRCGAVAACERGQHSSWRLNAREVCERPRALSGTHRRGSRCTRRRTRGCTCRPDRQPCRSRWTLKPWRRTSLQAAQVRRRSQRRYRERKAGTTQQAAFSPAAQPVHTLAAAKLYLPAGHATCVALVAPAGV